MKYLLDTMVWLWSVGSSETIGNAGLEILANGDEEIYLSAASSWEIAIKTELGKFRLARGTSQIRSQATGQEQGIHSLSISQSHSLKVYDLPLHHSDPFDRLLIAQAISEEMCILTSDRIFQKYPVEVLWCGT